MPNHNFAWQSRSPREPWLPTKPRCIRGSLAEDLLCYCGRACRAEVRLGARGEVPVQATVAEPFGSAQRFEDGALCCNDMLLSLPVTTDDYD